MQIFDFELVDGIMAEKEGRESNKDTVEVVDSVLSIQLFSTYHVTQVQA